MSAEIVNLRRARKDRTRTEKEAEAAANRAKHGRTRTERDHEALERARVTRGLDGHRLRATGDDGDAP